MSAPRSLLIVLMLALAAACAPKTAPPPATPGLPRYPEYVFPKAAPGMSGAVLLQHENAWRFLQAGDLRAAERGFTQITKRSPDLYPAHAGLGYAALARKDHKAALEHFNHALTVAPQYAAALVGRGHAYLAMNEPGRALENFDAAVAVEPTLAAVKHSADVLRLQVMQGGVGAARKAAQEGRLTEARAAYEQAIMTSPQSPFLFREIALVELKDGRLPAALSHARKAVELEPGDPRNHIAVADVLETLGDVPQALEALTAAAALEPGEALTRRIESLRERSARAALPAEYRAIESAPAISRAQLASLIGVQLADVVARAPQRGGALITDVRANWASQWILAVTRVGFMDVLPNHTFQPEAPISRGDLALSASRMLSAVAVGKPQLAARLRNARRKFTDLPPGHLRHPAASVAVEAGVMAPDEDGSFQLTRPVSGVEALAAIARVRELAGSRQ
jgi:tetratricopeptide (TPR) repeat protein